jgi:PIN domain nuclease of toxin-antitoxin system
MILMTHYWIVLVRRQIVKLLLDTHIFLWIIINPKQLSQTVKALCSSGEHEFFLSMASPWEIQIKNQLGKLSLAMPIDELVSKNRL